jgi:hypothetical protein
MNIIEHRSFDDLVAEHTKLRADTGMPAVLVNAAPPPKLQLERYSKVQKQRRFKLTLMYTYHGGIRQYGRSNHALRAETRVMVFGGAESGLYEDEIIAACATYRDMLAVWSGVEIKLQQLAFKEKPMWVLS